MAAQNPSGMKYWKDGLPIGVVGPQAKLGTFRYWYDGLPAVSLIPSAPTSGIGKFFRAPGWGRWH